MKRRSVVHIMIVLLLFWAGTGVEASESLGVPDVLIQQALAENTELHALQAQWQMAAHRVTPAQALDDPQLSLSLSNYPVDSLRDDRSAMTGKEIKLLQKFPFPGKRAQRGEMAAQQALWFKGVYEDERLQLTGRVKQAYFELKYQRQAMAITRANLTLLDDFILLTETRYQVGTGLQQDVLKAQLERSRLTDQLLSLAEREQLYLAQLNSLLNRATTTSVTVPLNFDLTVFEVPLATLQQAVETRPLAAAYAALLERYRSQQRLAHLDFRPDFTVGLGYRQREANRADDGTDFVGAELRFNLPLNQQRRSEAVAEAQSGQRMAQAQFDDFRRNVRRQLHETYSQLERSRQREALYRSGLLPQARQTYQGALAAYQVDRVDFLTLMTSLLSLQRDQLDYYRALTDHQLGLSRIEMLTGQTVSQLVDLMPTQEIK